MITWDKPTFSKRNRIEKSEGGNKGFYSMCGEEESLSLFPLSDNYWISARLNSLPETMYFLCDWENI